MASSERGAALKNPDETGPVQANSYNAGVPLVDISMFLGHSSPATTKRFYAALGVPLNPMLKWSEWRPPIAEAA